MNLARKRLLRRLGFRFLPLLRGFFLTGSRHDNILLHYRSKNFIWNFLHFFCFTASAVPKCLYVHITMGFYPVQQSVFLFNTEWFHCFSLFTVSTIGPNRENSEVRCLAWCNAPVLSHITGLKVSVLTPAVRVCRVRAVKRENNSFRLPFLTSHCQQCLRPLFSNEVIECFFRSLVRVSGCWIEHGMSENSDMKWMRN